MASATEAREKAEAEAKKLHLNLGVAQNEFVKVRGNVSPYGAIGQRLQVRRPNGSLRAGKVVTYDEESGKHEVEFDSGTTRSYKLNETEGVQWDDKDIESVCGNVLRTVNTSGADGRHTGT